MDFVSENIIHSSTVMSFASSILPPFIMASLSAAALVTTLISSLLNPASISTVKSVELVRSAPMMLVR